MMIYQSIKTRYSSFVIDGYFSTFRECSYDSASGEYFVFLETPCFKFEKIREACYPPIYCSCDSLYFSDKKEVLLFVEFKNRTFDENDDDNESTISKIIKQAGDSLYLHSDISSNINDYFKVQCDFLAVVCDEKNQGRHLMPVQDLMLILSGSFIGGSGSSYFNKNLKKQIDDYIMVNYHQIPCLYTFIGLAKASQFTAILSSY